MKKELRMIPDIELVIAARIIAALRLRSTDDLKKASRIGVKSTKSVGRIAMIGFNHEQERGQENNSSLAAPRCLDRRAH